MRVRTPRPLPQLRLDQLGASHGTKDQIRRTVLGMSQETQNTLKGLDLTKVKPHQLGPVVVQLKREGKLTDDMASRIIHLRDKYPNKLDDDKPINLVQRMESVAKASVALGSRYAPGDQAQRYEEALYCVKGLQKVSEAIRSGQLLDVTA
jgi:hypothetical protein